MRFVFTDKKVDLADSVHSYAEKKIGKLDRFFRADAEAFVTFGVENSRCTVELTVHSGNTFFRAEESTQGDMRVAIDASATAIERQIRKNKTRLSKRLRQDAFEKEITVAPGEEVQEELEFPVVRTKKFPIKPMTVEEAILQMNLLDHTFFVFRNQNAGDAFEVVYKRKNGGYGLIESGD
ncbi:ribosome hibernation-promoting factor, HPF/YfiA family [Papillibacter cinnamivorans]|uniref:Ribosome hibernation promoting factor n=1 Tax=Papillibacter cinnamivorans DSM 12816 TaxID=1122930 RepID=A0A1W2A335_9FIRM|nr:ribosome-associated translation inhibitor RaiA [Papillibacter cinnamivorans]SMC55060.1 putative sigma-54 modulation protein [Papillibacter cinnamivorans DSM 12816]